MRSLATLILCLGLLTLFGCGSDGSGPTDSTGGGLRPPPGGVNEFSYSPIDLSLAGTITPLGNLNPPGHVLPTDHAYIYAVDFDVRPPIIDTLVRTVYAPATGVVNFMLLQASNDWKVQFLMTEEMGYYLDHIQPRTGLKVGDIVQAGEVIGQTDPGVAIDLGAWDRRVTLPGLLVPERYPEQTLHCVSPWKYFTEPLRTQIYARVRRSPNAADKDGRIDFGVPGCLVGDWFHESLPKTYGSSSPVGWPKTLAFVYDYYDPDLVRVSIGGTVATPGAWAIPDDAPRPVDVSPASGVIHYRLLYQQTHPVSTQWGLMIVQMLSEDSIRVEVHQGSQDATADFSDSAQIYVR